MTFEEVLTQAIAMLQRLGRVSYRALKRQFALDDAFLEDLKYELTEVQQFAVDHDGTVLVWTGDTSTATVPMPAPATSAAMPPPAMRQAREPLAYTPPYLAEKIFTSRSALAGERKRVTVLFADLKGSMELLADRDPEEARQLLDPMLERLMAAVHRYEGTVNDVMGDGIMALFGAPIAHEDHAMRACYAALARAHQERGHQAYALRLLGEIAARCEPPESVQAGEYYSQALALAEELGMRPLQAHCHLGLGTLYAAIGQRKQARAALATAITLYRDTNMTFWLPQTEAALARVQGS